MPHAHAGCPCLLLVACCWLSVSIINSLFHSLADLLWLCCAGTAERPRGHDSTAPSSNAEDHRPQPKVGNTEKNPPESRKPASSCALAGLKATTEDDVNESPVPSTWQLACFPLFARCFTLIVSVCLQIAEFDSLGDWEQFRDNHAYGFASLLDRRCEARPGQAGWVLMLLACLYSHCLNVGLACLYSDCLNRCNT